jgi:hypothetical protein
MLHDISTRMAEIEITRQVQDIALLVVDFDYTKFPVKMTVGSVASSRDNDDNKSNILESWDSAVRWITTCSHPEDMVIVRARVPNGRYVTTLSMTGNIRSIPAHYGMWDDESLSMWIQ